MPLLLPTPTTNMEELADTVIRDLEAIRPIDRSQNIATWLQRVMQLGAAPGADPDLLLCVTGRIIRALPVTDPGLQWATLVMIHDTPVRALIPRVLNQTIHLHQILRDLFDFTMGAVTPSPEQLEVRLRTTTLQFLTTDDPRSRLTPQDMDAVRAGFLRLRDDILVNA